ncbi:MAG: hypothetical protein M3Y91_09900 [Actinomycetota bacterium]|nr:hypothetical protein [Actinomycetota bacterium]
MARPCLRRMVRGALGHGAVAGFAGTAAMTTGYAIERRLRKTVRGPLDLGAALQE